MRNSIIYPTLINQQFGYLKVLSRSEYKHPNSRSVYYRCGCWCGNYTIVEARCLRSGRTKTCVKCELDKKYKSEYWAWMHMKMRCNNPKDEYYKDYGGRGIIVCERWNTSFQYFLEDMGLKEDINLTLERKNVNGNYESNNCEWATRAAQAQNRRTSYVNRI